MPTHTDREQETDPREHLAATHVRSAKLTPTLHEYSPITSLDGEAMEDEHVTRANEQVERYTQRRNVQRAGSQKLDVAKKFEHKSEQDLRSMCMGLEEELASIGYSISNAYEFRGTEKVWAFVGSAFSWKGAQERAIHSRLQRLETQSIADSVKEIANRSQMMITELGMIQKEYDSDIGSVELGKGYKFDLANTLAKYKAAQPIYEEAKAARIALESEISGLQQELDAGTVGESERPAQEEKLKGLRDDLDAVKRRETDNFEIVRIATQSMPEIRKSLEAAQESVKALIQMRRGLLEKTQNFKSVLENAMTAVRAKAKLEAYQAVDPAFNTATTQITENNVKTAVAAIEIALQRAAKAAISPEDSARLLNELLAGINNYMTGMADLQEQTAKGVFSNSAANENFDDVDNANSNRQ